MRMFEIRHGFCWWLYTDRLPTISKNINTLSVNHTTILASLSNSLATKAFIIKSYELTNNRLAKKLHVYCTKIKIPPPYPETKNAGPCPNILEMLRWQSGGPTRFYHSKGCQSPEYPLASRAHQPHVVEPTANAWLNATNMAPRAWMGGGAPEKMGKVTTVVQGIHIRV